jgi:hypothetical protein
MSNDAVTRRIDAHEIGRLMAEHATAIAHEHAVNDKFRAERDAAIAERDGLRVMLRDNGPFTDADIDANLAALKSKDLT